MLVLYNDERLKTVILALTALAGCDKVDRTPGTFYEVVGGAIAPATYIFESPGESLLVGYNVLVGRTDVDGWCFAERHDNGAVRILTDDDLLAWSPEKLTEALGPIYKYLGI